VKCLETVRSYEESVPTFLRNRPPFFFEHCIKRAPPSSNIRREDVSAVNLEVYIVKRPEQAEGHVVRLQSETDPRLPFCDCADWARFRLPCKHILAVILYGDPSIGWSSLPEYYRSIPQFNVDDEIATAGVYSQVASTGYTAYTEGMQVLEGLTQTEIASTGICSPAESTGDTEGTQPQTESAVCVTSLQSKLRPEFLQNCRIAEFLQQQLKHLQRQLQMFKQHSGATEKKRMFRIGRRTVRKNIRASFLHRRLAAIRARRATKRKRRQLKKSQLSGYDSFQSKFMLLTVIVPSMLRCCWLSGRKGIQSVRNSLVICWCGYVSGSRCIFVYGPSLYHCHPLVA